MMINLAGAESATQKISLSQGMLRVANRHPGLAALASGKHSLSVAASLEPKLKTLLQD